jgi:hypothetical protein
LHARIICTHYRSTHCSASDTEQDEISLTRRATAASFFQCKANRVVFGEGASDCREWHIDAARACLSSKCRTVSGSGITNRCREAATRQ